MDSNFLKIIFSQQVVPQQVFPSRYFVLDTLSPFTSHPHFLFILTHLPMAPSQHSGFGGFPFFSFRSLDCSRLSQIKQREWAMMTWEFRTGQMKILQFISQYNTNRFSGKALELKFWDLYSSWLILSFCDLVSAEGKGTRHLDTWALCVLCKWKWRGNTWSWGLRVSILFVFGVRLWHPHSLLTLTPSTFPSSPYSFFFLSKISLSSFLHLTLFCSHSCHDNFPSPGLFLVETFISVSLHLTTLCRQTSLYQFILPSANHSPSHSHIISPFILP